MNDAAVPVAIDRPFEVITDPIPPGRKALGRAVIWGASILFGLIVLVQGLDAAGATQLGFANWRPALYAYVAWSIGLGFGLVMIYGEAGMRALFILPAALFTIAVVIFPTLFGLSIAFTDWNL